jgi:1-acyl-sn-glycerol-3-phosphate acyltransferase
MFDVPAGLMTFRRLGVKPLIVVSQRQLESIRLGRLKWRGVGVLPIASGAEGRRTLIQAGCGALAAGQSVALMPEGRVIREGFSSSSVRSGAAHLAVESGASVIVLGSAGSERFWRRGSLASFVAVRRSPVVVVCHTSIQPTDDVEFMKQSIVVSMAEAERSAREILHGIAAGS